jgi:hypothetical protein
MRPCCQRTRSPCWIIICLHFFPYFLLLVYSIHFLLNVLKFSFTYLNSFIKIFILLTWSHISFNIFHLNDDLILFLSYMLLLLFFLFFFSWFWSLSYLYMSLIYYCTIANFVVFLRIWSLRNIYLIDLTNAVCLIPLWFSLDHIISLFSVFFSTFEFFTLFLLYFSHEFSLFFATLLLQILSHVKCLVHLILDFIKIYSFVFYLCFLRCFTARLPDLI